MQVQTKSPRGVVRGGILSKALEQFEKQYGASEKIPFKDRHGTYAYSLPKFKYIICAKSKPYIDPFRNVIVSCNIGLIRHAIDNHLRLLMFIASEERFYEFDALEIIHSPSTINNERNFVKMTNFKLDLGRTPEQLVLFSEDLEGNNNKNEE
jgi:hypothetical protein